MLGFPTSLTKQSSIWSLVGLALVMAGLGCAASAPPLATSTPVPQPTATPLDTPTSRVAEIRSPADDVPVGTNPGDRIPDFVLDLGDGSTVTSQQLLSEGQPTFLFLFATW